MGTRSVVTTFIMAGLLAAIVAIGYTKFVKAPPKAEPVERGMRGDVAVKQKPSEEGPIRAQEQPPKKQKPKGEPLSEKDIKVPKEEQAEMKPDPKYVVPPVTTEPEEPEQEEAEKLPGYKKLLGGGWMFITDQPRVVVPAFVCNRAGEMEFFACGSDGRTYESVLGIDCDPFQLNMAIMMCKLTPGVPPEKLGDPTVKQGSRALLFVQWKNRNGKVVTHRAEDLVLSSIRGSAMPRVGWTFAGSRFLEDFDEQGKPTGKKIFMASITRVFIDTAWEDQGGGSHNALLGSPLPEAREHAHAPANWSILPNPMTPVKLIIRAPTEEEKKEIARVEKELVHQDEERRRQQMQNPEKAVKFETLMRDEPPFGARRYWHMAEKVAKEPLQWIIQDEEGWNALLSRIEPSQQGQLKKLKPDFFKEELLMNASGKAGVLWEISKVVEGDVRLYAVYEVEQLGMKASEPFYPVSIIKFERKEMNPEFVETKKVEGQTPEKKEGKK